MLRCNVILGHYQQSISKNCGTTGPFSRIRGPEMGSSERLSYSLPTAGISSRISAVVMFTTGPRIPSVLV